MSEKFSTEKDGQIDFYNQFLPRINPTITVDEIIANNNDGVLNGNLIEFKLTVKDLNEVLFQCIKYLSALRIKGVAPYFWDSLLYFKHTLQLQEQVCYCYYKSKLQSYNVLMLQC